MSQKNAADPKELKAAKKREDFAESRFQAALKSVLESPNGRLVVWDFMGMGNIHSVTFTGNAHGSFLEGKRAMALQIEAEVLKNSPNAYILMMQESRKREESNG